MALDQARANEILSYIHGGGQPPTIAGSRLRLMTVNGTATSNGTEVATGGGYSAAAGAPTLSWAAPSGGAQATAVAVNVTNYPRYEDVVGIELWDTSPKRVEFGALTAPKTMAAGDTLSFAQGAITSALG